MHSHGQHDTLQATAESNSSYEGNGVQNQETKQFSKDLKQSFLGFYVHIPHVWYDTIGCILINYNLNSVYDCGCGPPGTIFEGQRKVAFI